MAKAKQSFVQQYEVVPGAIVVALAAAVSFGWWKLIESGALLDSITLQKVSPLIMAAVVIFILQSGKFNRKQQSNWLRALTHASALTVLLMLFWDWWHWLHLNSNWFSERTFYTGQAGFTFLILSLACTPLNTLFGWSSLNALKKPLGNYGFIFILIHLGVFVFDFSFLGDSFDFSLAVAATFKKNYALVGFVAFVLLVPLALTSNKWSIKKLGKKWKKLHQLVYVIAVLGAVHYIWVWMSKRALEKPIAFAIVVAFLLFLRVDWVKNRIREFKKSRRAAKRVAA